MPWRRMRSSILKTPGQQELLPDDHAACVARLKRLGYPLLAGSVTNDVALGRETRFFLISGSNMSGKSTLLRSTGTNAVSGYAGAPVRAKSLRLTPLRLGASLALTDSLAEGRSKFLAEAERLLHAIVKASRRPCDAAFGRRNLQRNELGGSADSSGCGVLDRLLKNGAIGAPIDLPTLL